jgi:hypothetical protein
MNRLTNDQELLITRFSDQLSVVVGPEDMFPPDPGGVRELAPSPEPQCPSAEALCLNGIYNLASYRRMRLLSGSQKLIGTIDAMLEPTHA